MVSRPCAKPRAHGESGKEKYSFSAICEKPETLKNLREDVIKTAKEKWPDLIQEGDNLFFENASGKKVEIRLPFKDGSVEKPKDEAYNGNTFFNVSSQSPIMCVDNMKNSIEPSKVYAGCYVKAVVNPSAYDVDGSRGVTLYCDAVQFIRHGDKLGGGGANAVAQFETFESEEEADFHAAT